MAAVVVVVVNPVPDPAWLCERIRKGGEWGWLALPHSGGQRRRWWERGWLVVAVVVGRRNRQVGCVEQPAGFGHGRAALSEGHTSHANRRKVRAQ